MVLISLILVLKVLVITQPNAFQLITSLLIPLSIREIPNPYGLKIQLLVWFRFIPSLALADKFNRKRSVLDGYCSNARW